MIGIPPSPCVERIQTPPQRCSTTLLFSPTQDPGDRKRSSESPSKAECPRALPSACTVSARTRRVGSGPCCCRPSCPNAPRWTARTAPTRTGCPFPPSFQKRSVLGGFLDLDPRQGQRDRTLSLRSQPTGQEFRAAPVRHASSCAAELLRFPSSIAAMSSVSLTDEPLFCLLLIRGAAEAAAAALETRRV